MKPPRRKPAFTLLLEQSDIQVIGEGDLKAYESNVALLFLHNWPGMLTGLHSFPGLFSALFSGFCGCGCLLVVVGLLPHFLFVFSSWRPLTSFPQGPLRGLLTTWQFTLSRPRPAVRSLIRKGSQSLFKGPSIS